MSGLHKTKKSGGVSRRDGLAALARVLNVRNAWSAGVLSAICLLGIGSDAAFAQDNLSSIPVAKSAWTSPSGRVVVDLKAKQENAANASRKTAKKARPIRQTQALTAAPTSDDELLAPSNFDDPLLSPETLAPSDSDDLLDPTTLDRAPLASPLDESEFDDATLESVPTTKSEPRLADPLSSAPTTNGGNTFSEQQRQMLPSTIPNSPAERSPSSFAPTLSPSPIATPENSNAARRAANQNAYYGNVSASPRVSAPNPYAQIGQAEYNPNQFYGGGGNGTVNGYRKNPPVAAYGQNLWGDPCVENECVGYGYGCCGLLQNASLEAGVLGMRSPLDFEDTGNFGADFALNWASAQPLFCGLNAQAGARVTQTDLNGTEANGFETDDARTQLFWTAGLFFRAPICSNGWNAGVVYDYLKDDYYRNYEASQIRAELSRSFGGFCDIGFRGAFALDESDFEFLNLGGGLTIDAKAAATSYYTMFIRKRFMQGAEATVFGGVTEFDEGIVGANVEAPISPSFAVKGGATYVIPTDRGLDKLRLEENWNVSCGLVWRLGGNAQDATCGNRPLFDVADNGSFLQNFLR